MKNKITYLRKCELCGEKTEWIWRDKDSNISPTLQDSDLYLSISMSVENPRSFDYCEKCELTTLQTRIAWDFVDTFTDLVYV